MQSFALNGICERNPEETRYYWGFFRIKRPRPAARRKSQQCAMSSGLREKNTAEAGYARRTTRCIKILGLAQQNMADA